MRRGGLGAPPEDAGRRLSPGFVERTLAELRGFFLRSVLSDRYARAGGFMQGLDGRVKVAALLVVVASLGLLRHVVSVVAVFVAVLVVARASGIPLRTFLRGGWLTVPLFACLTAAPALLNVFVPGEPVLDIVHIGAPRAFGPLVIPETLSVTRQGLASAAMLAARVTASASVMMLLVLTTSRPALFRSLRALGVPQVFTFTAAMALRYTHLLLRLVEAVHLARRSRTVTQGRAGEGRQWVASQMGSLLRRSVATGAMVHRAMVSRGYSDELRCLEGVCSPGRRELAWSSGAALFLALLFMADNYLLK